MAGETILVADDDRAIRTVVTHALTRQGYEVRATGNAANLSRVRLITSYVETESR